MIRLVIPGRPVPKGRPRLGMHGRKAYVYTPPQTVEYEKLVGWVAKATGCRPVEGPVEVEIWCYMRGKADADNLSKSILDGLNGIAFMDDGQVVDLHVHKRKVKAATDERVEIEIREAG
jgi:crossover junction endodeoxyribonuclease RusA